MRVAALASLFTAGLMWLALGGAPAESQPEEKAASCQTCGKGQQACPHCAQGKCPNCAYGKDCPRCEKGKTCPHCAHHSKWGAHEWEYKCIRPAKKLEGMSQQFTELGADGWRLKEADGGIWCFKRMQRSE